MGFPKPPLHGKEFRSTRLTRRGSCHDVSADDNQLRSIHQLLSHLLAVSDSCRWMCGRTARPVSRGDRRREAQAGDQRREGGVGRVRGDRGARRSAACRRAITGHVTRSGPPLSPRLTTSGCVLLPVPLTAAATHNRAQLPFSQPRLSRAPPVFDWCQQCVPRDRYLLFQCTHRPAFFSLSLTPD